MSIRFFTQDLLDNFKGLLENSGLNLYCYDFLEKEKKISRLPSSMKKCCGTNIGTGYINSQSRNLKNEKNTFDLALVTFQPHENFTSTKLDENILGFIIVQKGECNKFNDTYCINLICSSIFDERAKGMGSILIALYLYCIINNNNVIDKRGLLELANSYINMGGLCLYSKYGFEYDPSLYGDDCFNDHNNLPMIVDIETKYGGSNNDESNQIIKNILVGNNKGFPKPDICAIRDNDKQLLLGCLMNLNMFLDLDTPEYIISFIKSDDITVEYDVLYNSLGNNPNAVKSKINELMSKELTTNDRELLTNVYIIPQSEPVPPPLPPPKEVTTMTTRKRNRRQAILGGSRKQKKHKKKYLKK